MSACLICQAIQMASDENLGIMIRRANRDLDREMSRRLAVEVEHAACGPRIAELEATVRRQNNRLRKKAS